MVIFDLDQTLIDSAASETLRRQRRWADVYKLVPTLEPFPGISNLLQELANRKIRTAIVTSSPRPYCQRVIQCWKWEIAHIVAYHDTNKHKPYPEPIVLALSKAETKPKNAFHVGDLPADTVAAKAAGVVSLGALWGSPDPQALIRSSPDHLFSSVDELSTFLTNWPPELIG